jgi:hypothetical protein
MLKNVFKKVYQLSQRTRSRNAAKLGVPVSTGIQPCPVSLTIFVRRFIIFKTGAELFPGLLVIRRKLVRRPPVGDRGRTVFFLFEACSLLGTRVEY